MLKLATGLAVLALATTVAAQPYGPGMMGGAGPGGWDGGYGPGMMGGWGGGYGPGMMGGGMGPGMMWGPGGGALADLDLSKEQRDKIAEIQGEVRRQHWAMMRGMQQQEWHMADAWRDDGSFDEQAARKAFDAMTAQRKAMFELMLDARRRIDAVLTPAQREQLKRRGGGR
jgi:Spy/CpxP family protein refolding chaperone